MAELDAGLSWAVFSRRVVNFSPASVWSALMQREGDAPIEDPEAALRALESFG